MATHSTLEHTTNFPHRFLRHLPLPPGRSLAGAATLQPSHARLAVCATHVFARCLADTKKRVPIFLLVLGGLAKLVPNVLIICAFLARKPDKNRYFCALGVFIFEGVFYFPNITAKGLFLWCYKEKLCWEFFCRWGLRCRAIC